MGQTQRRKPARMTLSPRVAQIPPKAVENSVRRRRMPNSPFGGMNLTEANIGAVPRRRSQAEQKRATRGKEEPEKAKDDPETYKALKMQSTLSSVSHIHRAAVKARISEIDSFAGFALLPVIQDSISPQALQGLENISPTPIQRLAIPVLLHQRPQSKASNSLIGKKDMEQFLLAAETGSGKTLAYLLPVVDAIKRAELANEYVEKRAENDGGAQRTVFELEPPPLSNESHSTTGRPRAIILLPTSELVSQVGAIAKSLSHTVKFRTSLISAAYSSTVIRNRLFSPSGIDVLISTPHLLASIAESDPNILARVTHLVCDEADSLFDRSFSPLTSAIIDKASPSLRQLILCSATIPRSLDSYLRKRFPDMRRLVTPNLHAVPRRVQLGVVDIEKQPYQGNRLLACADAIWSIGKSANEHQEEDVERAEVKRIIVFVNEREKSVEVAEYLQSKGIEAVALNRDTNEQRQSEILASFTSAGAREAAKASNDMSIPFEQPIAKASENDSSRSNSSQRRPPRRTLPNTKVLVMTDLGSRGIDTLAVRHVILYDVPHTTVDFIHRLGRTGRMGKRGRGIVLVGRGDRRDIVREVREGMFKGQALI